MKDLAKQTTKKLGVPVNIKSSETGVQVVLLDTVPKLNEETIKNVTRSAIIASVAIEKEKANPTRGIDTYEASIAKIDTLKKGISDTYELIKPLPDDINNTALLERLTKLGNDSAIVTIGEFTNIVSILSFFTEATSLPTVTRDMDYLSNTVFKNYDQQLRILQERRRKGSTRSIANVESEGLVAYTNLKRIMDNMIQIGPNGNLRIAIPQNLAELSKILEFATVMCEKVSIELNNKKGDIEKSASALLQRYKVYFQKLAELANAATLLTNKCNIFVQANNLAALSQEADLEAVTGGIKHAQKEQATTARQEEEKAKIAQAKLAKETAAEQAKQAEIEKLKIKQEAKKAATIAKNKEKFSALKNWPRRNRSGSLQNPMPSRDDLEVKYASTRTQRSMSLPMQYSKDTLWVKESQWVDAEYLKRTNGQETIQTNYGLFSFHKNEENSLYDGYIIKHNGDMRSVKLTKDATGAVTKAAVLEPIQQAVLKSKMTRG